MRTVAARAVRASSGGQEKTYDTRNVRVRPTVRSGSDVRLGIRYQSARTVFRGAVGHADVRSTVRTDPTYEFHEPDTGWKVVIGMRPIGTLAAELEYVDFGHAHSTSNASFLC